MRKETNHARFAKVLGKSWKVVFGCSYKASKTKQYSIPSSETVVDQSTVVEVFSLFRLSTHTDTFVFPSMLPFETS